MRSQALVAGALLLAAFLLTSCRCAGTSEREKAGEAPTPTPTSTAAASTPAPTAASTPPSPETTPSPPSPSSTPKPGPWDRLRSRVRWTGEPGERDLAQDAAFCDAIVKTDPHAADPRLRLMAQLACLEQMGWESTAPKQARARKKRAEPEAKEEPEVAAKPSPLEDQVVWVGDGPRPDLRKAQQRCRRRVADDPRVRGQPGLAFLGELACLGEMGWEPDGDMWDDVD